MIKKLNEKHSHVAYLSSLIENSAILPRCRFPYFSNLNQTAIIITTDSNAGVPSEGMIFELTGRILIIAP